MLFSALPTASNPVVVLRPLVEEDLEPWSRYLNDLRVYEHTSWNHPTPAELRSYIGNELDTSPGSRLRLAIALRSDGRFIGTAGFHSLSPENRTAELAYDLDPLYWSQGIATSIGNDLVAWAHSEAAVIRVQATVLESNTRSLGVLRRMGFVEEGILRSYRLVRGLPGNFVMLSHLQ